MKKEIYYLIAVAATLVVVVYFIVTNGGTPTISATPTPTPDSQLIQVTEEPTEDTMKKNTKNSTAKKQWNTPPELTIDSAKKYTATLKTSQGEIVIELAADTVPQTVNNFVFLARQKFYDNVIFHRIIDGFMIQSGDPKGDGTGGPGYRFDDEPFTGEYTRGTVAMANAGPNTNGSQFFIMHADAGLPKNYVIFGHVVTGLDVVDKIATAPVTTSPSGEDSQPVKPDKILNLTIVEE
ncbi:MAG: peptidylprolyl isomerase [Patescibacteria group bacterium]|jgi:cyclophilin family peptidyl-prolyl cis-trans isomerase